MFETERIELVGPGHVRVIGGGRHAGIVRDYYGVPQHVIDLVLGGIQWTPKGK